MSTFEGVIPTVPEAVAAAAKEELARRSLLDFCKLMIPGFQAPPHIKYIAELLESVERGKQRKLLVSLHPGAGKSVLLQAFVAWYLGKHPTHRIITASAGAELAERNSRASRGFFTDSAWPFDAGLSKDTTAMNRWNTTAGGGVFACGVLGLISGWRSSGPIVLDDIQNDALSVGERESLWDWYRSVLLARREPGAGIVVIQQRWGSDDLPARLLESAEGKEFLHVALPAIALENDPLGRKIGKSLWPSRWPLAELENQRVAMGSRAFETAYQGLVTPAEGNLIKREWLQYYDQPPTEFTKVVCGIDAAAKTGIHNDESCIVKIGVTKNGYYLLDCWTARVEFPDLLKRVIALEDEDPKPSVVYVEDASNATAMLQVLKTSSRIPVVGVTAKGSKLSRVEACTGVFESKKVFFPHEAPWLLTLEGQLLGFPGAKRDDAVDALCLGLSQVSNRKMSKNFWFTFGGNGPDEHYFGPDDHSPCSEETVGSMGSVTGALTRLGL